MHDFASQLLASYFLSSGWNYTGSYLHLTSTSSSLLDFPLPSALSLSISASPSPPFFTTYRLRALPHLDGQIGYLFARTRGELSMGESREKDLRAVAHAFRIVDLPRTPTAEEVAKTAQAPRDYLLYGSLHVPSLRVDALYTLRLTPCTSFLLTALSHPSASSPLQLHERSSSSSSSSGSGGADAPQQAVADAKAGKLGLQLTLQRDTGRWFTEYSYSLDEALWGFRVLHNFGVPNAAAGSSSSSGSGVSASSFESAGAGSGSATEEHTTTTTSTALEEPQQHASTSASAAPSAATSAAPSGTQRIGDDEHPGDSVGASWQGRFSAGAEMFFSARERSAGLSTGLRFSTLPPPRSAPTSSSTLSSSSSSSPSEEDPSLIQPPTTITATLNPMMGHLSVAYASRMARDLVACSRYDFNVYSYDSELTFGVEYWLRAAAGSARGAARSNAEGEEEMMQLPHGSTAAAARDVVAPSPHARRPSTSLRERDARFGFDAAPPASASASAARPTASASLREPPVSEHERYEHLAASTQQLSLRDPSPAPPPDPTRTSTAADPTTSNIAAAAAEASSSPASASASASASGSTPGSASANAKADPPLLGILKARLSTSGVLALLWEGRLHSTLVSFGVRADLSSASLRYSGGGAGGGGGYGGRGNLRPLRGIGLDLQYFGTRREAECEQGRKREGWAKQEGGEGGHTI